MKCVAIIPARYQSSRFEGKPLAKICGKPMIQRVCENVIKARGIAEVAVATDDSRIAAAVEAFGAKVVMTGEKNRSGTDRVAEAARNMELSDSDVVVNVQGDQPLIHPNCLDEVVAPFSKDPDVVMTTLAFKIVREEEITNPKDVKVVCDKNGSALYFSRSPVPFGRDPEAAFDMYKHLGVYAYTKKFLDIFANLPDGRLENIEKLEQLRALEHGYAIKVSITEHDSPEVDLPEDIALVEKILSHDRTLKTE